MKTPDDKCQVCGGALPLMKRTYCTDECRRDARNARVSRRAHNRREARVRAFIEDVEWMAATGECLSGAASRLGRSADGLANTLQRLGRLDLARTLRGREADPKAYRYLRETA